MQKEEDIKDPFATLLLTEALTWVGTPFKRGQRIKGIGIDCGRFIDACFEAAGVETGGLPLSYSGGSLLYLLENCILQEVGDRRLIQPADVLAFADENCRNMEEPVHVAFVEQVTPMTTFIIEAGRKCVSRHRIHNLWWRRLHSIWHYPR